MLFKQNNMINLGNYEEYFILYMDNELSAADQLMVENFIAQYPHLAEELDILMSTKLPAEEVSFKGKEELFSSFMKVATVDEALLLYIDDELTASEAKAVEEKIAGDKDYALQHAALLQTKLDATEKIPHPNKKELYRHTERVITLKTWMRIAAVIILLVFGSLFFLLNKKETIEGTEVATRNPAVTKPSVSKEPVDRVKELTEQKQIAIKESIAQTTTSKTQATKGEMVVAQKDKKNQNLTQPIPNGSTNAVAHQQQRQRETIRFDATRFTNAPEINEDAVAINNTITRKSVTSYLPDRTIINEDTPETADLSGDFKNTKGSSAKGLFRKITRFIGRNTGIGIASSDDEVLIGTMALKLK